MRRGGECAVFCYEYIFFLQTVEDVALFVMNTVLLQTVENVVFFVMNTVLLQTVEDVVLLL